MRVRRWRNGAWAWHKRKSLRSDELSLKNHLAQAASLLNASATDALEEKMARAVEAIATALAQDKALLVCGNGGSASDALHIAGELVAQFNKKRRALKAICL